MYRKNRQAVKLLDEYGVLNINGTEFLFDIEDFPVINSRNWYVDKDGYLASSYIYNGRRCFAMFHRIIMNAQKGQVVDHINRNRADNRKVNLRCCSKFKNNLNRGRRSTNTSGVIGVHYDSKRDKWIANITYGKRRIFIGRFISKDEAVKARLHKEAELFKSFAPQANGEGVIV